MKKFLYDAVTTFAAPAGALYLLMSPRYRSLLGRFQPQMPGFSSAPVWVHACSVGEWGVGNVLSEGLRSRWPGIPLLLTASTVTGLRAARKTATVHDAAATWFPFDHPAVVGKFFRRARPRILLLVETEIWPNVLHEAARCGVPRVLVNARLSDRRYPAYQRLSRWFGETVSLIDGVGVQNPEYAERFRSLGVPRERIRVTGNIKFDGVQASVPEEKKTALREVLGAEAGQPVVVFGSTRPGDEAMAAACWRALREAFEGLIFIIVPRHLDRVAEAQEVFGGEAVLRSELDSHKENAMGTPRVVVVDTMGELVDFYGIATAAVVGGSFDQRIQGHNPLEPAALGIPTIFGPHMRNFIDPAEALVDAGGAVQVASREDIAAALERFLGDDAGCASIGKKARQAVLANQGATRRTLDFVAEFLGEDAT